MSYEMLALLGELFLLINLVIATFIAWSLHRISRDLLENTTVIERQFVLVRLEPMACKTNVVTPGKQSS